MPRWRMIAALAAAVLFTFAAPVRAQVSRPASVTPPPAEALGQAPESGSFAPIPTPGPVSQTVTFDEAVRLALDRHPDAARAAQAIPGRRRCWSRRARFRSLNGTVTTTILNEERGFSGQVTQPQTQSAFGAQASFPSWPRRAGRRRRRQRTRWPSLASAWTRRAVR